MAEDLKNVRLSTHASEIADKIFDSGLFDDRVTIAKFALSYALKNHFNEINPESLDSQYDATGLNWNIGSLDNDKFLSGLITSLYPSCTTPYRYARVIMCFGLEKLGSLLSDGKLYPISALL